MGIELHHIAGTGNSYTDIRRDSLSYWFRKMHHRDAGIILYRLARPIPIAHNDNLSITTYRIKYRLYSARKEYFVPRWDDN
jgi:hypothetical protein